MGKKVLYRVEESKETGWNNGRVEYKPKFQLIKEGELICEMVSSHLLENTVRLRFQEMAERFNEKPFRIDEKH